MADKNFKVVIVGGGVAGLTLANMLERFDIQYVVLESHGDIAPAVGASIGLLPNGLRILDQIGCYQKICDLPRQQILTTAHRDFKGKLLFSVDRFGDKLEARHGFTALFFDRQWLLRILYDNLRHRDRILLNMRVAKVDRIDSGIQVTTKDGKVVKGSIVVGADGVYSVVREQMVRMGDTLQPGYFPPGMLNRVPCYYRCSFGIAQNVEGYMRGQQNNVRAKNWSSLVLSGPEDRVYWFLFQRLPKPLYGEDIQRYTKEDELHFVREFWDAPITDTVTFGQVYSKKLSSTLTPLHEFVYEKWFFDRIILIGDSAHKPNPITGQGGNGAMETAAELVNAILRMRDGRPDGLAGLGNSDVERIFQQTHSARYEREKYLIDAAHRAQALSAFENRLLATFMCHIVFPLAGDDLLISSFSDSIIDGARLEQLPVSPKEKIIPFTDELPAKPMSRSAARLVLGCFCGGMVGLIRLAGKSLRIPLADLGRWAGVSVLSRPWSEVGAGLLRTLVSFFSFPLEGQPAGGRVHLIHFLSQLASPVLLYTMDGYRAGNQPTILSLPSIILAVMQVKGIAFVAPAYALIRALQYKVSPTSRHIPREAGEALLPAMVLGYAVPTAMMLRRGISHATKQDLTALWQFSPIMVPALTRLLSSGIRWWRSRKQRVEKTANGVEKTADGVGKTANGVGSASSWLRDYADSFEPLERVYALAAATQALVHLATVAYACYDPEISVKNMFFGVPNPLSAVWDLPDAATKVAVFLRFDLGIASCAWLGSGLYSIWDLRRRGYVTTRDAVRAAISVCLGQVVVGPGTTATILSHWQDKVVVGLARRGA